MDKSMKNISRRHALKTLGASGFAIAAGIAVGNQFPDLSLAPKAEAKPIKDVPFKGYYVFASDPRSKMPGYVSMPG